MKIFSVPITLYGTAYVKAETAEAAHARASVMTNGCVEIMGDNRDLFCGLAFDNPCLPDLSISPAITIGDVDGLEFVEEVS
ncbi:hypothetical protein HBA92_21430 [Ochrobactrum sp. MR28]|nr:hypothetical protein [Ochrobactrum sp. MR28]MBX8818829.1 hypothetical protein [Ochrobactrum sp. MR31]